MENKKNPKLDLRKKSGLFLNIGFAISLSLVLFAFEYKSYDDGSLMELAAVNDDFEEMTEIPPTEQPPPPKIQQPEIIEVPDEEEIEDEIEVDLDIDITDETVIEETIFEEPEEEEVADEIFNIVETYPSFPGGNKAFYKYISKKMKYPPQARRMGIEGKVFVQFVVDENGNISDVKLMRGVGAGCDEEAIRVIKNSPKWNPGKQRGKAVKVRMVLPITFKLS
ncbi:MAG: energy transducer TonB [Cyclobacteriaceae bacterium]|nr:energy transducer TonB [Cyclobacteriaceae bacterium]